MSPHSISAISIQILAIIGIVISAPHFQNQQIEINHHGKNDWSHNSAIDPIFDPFKNYSSHENFVIEHVFDPDSPPENKQIEIIHHGNDWSYDNSAIDPVFDPFKNYSSHENFVIEHVFDPYSPPGAMTRKPRAAQTLIAAPPHDWRPVPQSRTPRKHISRSDAFFEDDFDSSFGELYDDFDNMNELIKFSDAVSSDHTVLGVDDFFPNSHEHENRRSAATGHSNFRRTPFRPSSLETPHKPSTFRPIMRPSSKQPSHTRSHFNRHRSQSHSSHRRPHHHQIQFSHPIIHHSSEENEVDTSSGAHESHDPHHINHVMKNLIYRADAPIKHPINENDRVMGGSSHIIPAGINNLDDKDIEFIKEKQRPYVLGIATK